VGLLTTLIGLLEKIKNVLPRRTQRTQKKRKKILCFGSVRA